jgi:DNA-binding MarR family transcriptional regulator
MDVLSSKKTSAVFYCLARSIDSPNAIARELRISAPNVVQHLNLLRASGVVERGKRENRLRHYKINWGRIRDIGVELFPDLNSSNKRNVALEELSKEERDKLQSEPRPSKEVKSKLTKEPTFEILIARYLTSLADYDRLARERFGRTQVTGIPVTEALREMEGALIRVYRSGGTKWIKPTDPEARDLKKLLKEWYDVAEPTRPLSADALREALNDVRLTENKISKKLYLGAP